MTLSCTILRKYEGMPNFICVYWHYEYICLNRKQETKNEIKLNNDMLLPHFCMEVKYRLRRTNVLVEVKQRKLNF
jgi:hypothetical protein